MNLFRTLTMSQNSKQTEKDQTKNATAALKNSTNMEVQNLDVHVDKHQFTTSPITLTEARASSSLQRIAAGTQSTYQMPDGLNDTSANKGKCPVGEHDKSFNSPNATSAAINIPTHTMGLSTHSGYGRVENRGELKQQYSTQLYAPFQCQKKAGKDRNHESYGHLRRTDCSKRLHPYKQLPCKDASLADVLDQDYRQFIDVAGSPSNRQLSSTSMFYTAPVTGKHDMLKEQYLGLNTTLIHPNAMDGNFQQDMLRISTNINGLTSKPVVGDMQRILRKRAEFYGECLHPE